MYLVLDCVGMPLAVESFQYQAHVDHLERVYQSPEYTIDWPAVRAGTEAGLPGLWVSQSVTVTTHWLHDMPHPTCTIRVWNTIRFI